MHRIVAPVKSRFARRGAREQLNLKCDSLSLASLVRGEIKEQRKDQKRNQYKGNIDQHLAGSCRALHLPIAQFAALDDADLVEVLQIVCVGVAVPMLALKSPIKHLL
jgi:hypothetical protein